MNKPSSPSVLIDGSGAVRAHPTRGGPCYLVTIDDQNLLSIAGAAQCTIFRDLGYRWNRFPKLI